MEFKQGRRVWSVITSRRVRRPTMCFNVRKTSDTMVVWQTPKNVWVRGSRRLSCVKVVDPCRYYTTSDQTIRVTTTPTRRFVLLHHQCGKEEQTNNVFLWTVTDGVPSVHTFSVWHFKSLQNKLLNKHQTWETSFSRRPPRRSIYSIELRLEGLSTEFSRTGGSGGSRVLFGPPWGHGRYNKNRRER